MRGKEPFTGPAGGSEPPGPPARRTGAPRLYPLIRDEHAEDGKASVSVYSSTGDEGVICTGDG